MRMFRVSRRKQRTILLTGFSFLGRLLKPLNEGDLQNEPTKVHSIWSSVKDQA